MVTQKKGVERQKHRRGYDPKSTPSKQQQVLRAGTVVQDLRVAEMTRTNNFLEYHRPRLRLNRTRIPTLTRQSKECLRNFASYYPPQLPIPLPRTRCAAVLVALFVGRAGDVYVLLSRRSATLRSYAGDTSLPGGKVDLGDKTIEETARREAFEEIGLPRDGRKVPLLCVLEPFLASNDLIVTPVVVLILDLTLQPILNAAEVSALFSHPLASFLEDTHPFPQEPESIEVPYHTTHEWETRGPNGTVWPIRGHSFLTGREAGGIRPVIGLTAAILIRVAEIAYARKPSFEVKAPGEPTTLHRISWAMLNKPIYREAFEAEGVDVDWDAMRRMVEEQVEVPSGSSGRTETETRNRRDGVVYYPWRSWIPRRNTTRSKL
ncbi:NUDIX hydrolase domain-like protein [Amanita rubescens]|nr:NUDIX hydrolase domain-like protein [Amanita rubescens]